jgi:hypothetical protein
MRTAEEHDNTKSKMHVWITNAEGAFPNVSRQIEADKERESPRETGVFSSVCLRLPIPQFRHRVEATDIIHSNKCLGFQKILTLYRTQYLNLIFEYLQNNKIYIGDLYCFSR